MKNKKATDVKSLLERLFLWETINVGEYTETFVLAEGFSVDITYDTCAAYGDYTFDIICVVGADNKSRAILEVLGHDPDNFNADASYYTIETYLADLEVEYSKLYNDANDATDGNIELSNLAENYATFEHFWDYVKNLLEEESLEIDMGIDYNAIIKKGEEYINVGCRDIHIADIRALVKAYDKFQKE
jgi:hypothetical protein